MITLRIKTFYTLAIFLTVISTAVVAQTETESDTSSSDSLILSPNRQPIGKNGTGNYTFIESDTISRQLFNGFEVSNLLWRNVPGFNSGSSVYPSGFGIRNASPMVLIDGAPFNNSIAGLYNLNTFNFSSIAAVSSGNAVALYGGQGTDGAVILESKNGRDIHKAQFEANSTMAFTKFDEVRQYDDLQLEEENRMIFSNAIAYAQDYGKVDARVSYINHYLPDGSSEQQQADGSHSFKVNTGFEFSPKFSARAVADAFSHSSQTVNNGTDNDDLSRSLSGNIVLKYTPSEWLTLTSQSHYIKGRRDINRIQPSSTYTLDEGQHRALTNVMATFRPAISPDVSLTFMTGAQLQRQIDERETFQTSSYGSYYGTWIRVEDKTRTWLSSVMLQSWNLLTIGVNYRYDYRVDYRHDARDPSTYSVNTAFRFGEAFEIRNTLLTEGIVRANFGKTGAVETVSFPYTPITGQIRGQAFPPVNVYVNPYLQFTQRKSAEVGMDLYFLDSRLSLQSTYFHYRNDQTLALIPLPNSGNGVVYVLADVGENYAKGFEAVLGYDFYKRNNNAVSAKAIYAGYKSQVEPMSEQFEIYAGENTMIPDWTGSLLMQFRFNRVFGQMLCTHQSGGTYTYYSFPGWDSTEIDYTQTWLRDAAVGYAFRSISLSLTGRNLWQINAKQEDHEVYESSRIQKALMLSASFRF